MEVVRGRKKGSKARLFAVVVGTPRVRSGSYACFHFYMFACVCVCVFTFIMCDILYYSTALYSGLILKASDRNPRITVVLL